MGVAAVLMVAFLVVALVGRQGWQRSEVHPSVALRVDEFRVASAFCVSCPKKEKVLGTAVFC
jgi:hypothetical protein